MDAGPSSQECLRRIIGDFMQAGFYSMTGSVRLSAPLPPVRKRQSFR